MTGSWQDPLMGEAYHRLYGGSEKHDAVPELFEAGWNAVIEACGGTDHLLEIDPSGSWTVQHPITERLDGTLFECSWTGQTGILVFHQRFGEGEEAYGRWRGFVDDNGDRRWEKVTDAA